MNMNPKIPVLDRTLLTLSMLDWDAAKELVPDHLIFVPQTDGLQVKSIYGAFPTQAEGSVHGLPFYFRARHGDWTLGFGNDPIQSPVLVMSGDDPSAGMMAEKDVMEILVRGASLISFLRTANSEGSNT